MQSNLVEIRNQPVGLFDFFAERTGNKSDPFRVKDGRYVGSDGFVVPKDFEEFHRRFPDYVRRWVSKQAVTSASRDDIADWTQDLLIHLCSLALTSKYREAGKKDIVGTFDPLRHYGANEARFRNYINLCLANKFRTMRSKRMKDVLCRPRNFSFDEPADSDDYRAAVDEYCYAHSAQLQKATNAADK